MRRVVVVFIVGLLAGAAGGFGLARMTEDESQRPPSAFDPSSSEAFTLPAGLLPQQAIRQCRKGTALARTELRAYCRHIVLRPGRRIGVVGSDGKLIRCPDGKPLKVRMNDAPPPGLVRTKPTGEAGGAVPRCGPEGGGKHGQAIWVPASVGRGRVTAPRRFVEAQSE